MLQKVLKARNTKIIKKYELYKNYTKKKGLGMVKSRNPLILMVGPGGFEPPTSTVSR